MVLTKDTHLPTYEELQVEEVPLGSPYLKAGAFHLGKSCETVNNEFILCRQENRDPRACIQEGKDVTRCSNNFFRQIKQNCATQFTQYAMCLDKSSFNLSFLECRNTQAVFDRCMKDKLDMDRPPYGYHCLVKVHDTARPKVEEQRPKWLDDPRGQGRRPDTFPEDFPKKSVYGHIGIGNPFGL